MRHHVAHWGPVYWPLTCRQPTASQLRSVREGGTFVVVLGWDAGADVAVASRCVDVMSAMHGQALILTGATPSAKAAEILKESRVRSGVFLNVASHAGNREVNDAILGCLKNLGAKPGHLKCCLSLIVVSRCYQSRRIATLSSAIFQHKTEDASLDDFWEKVDVIPFVCGNPDEQIVEDINSRSSSILAEADLMLELCPDAFSAECLARLQELQAYARSPRLGQPEPLEDQEVRPVAKRAPKRKAVRKPEV